MPLLDFSHTGHKKIEIQLPTQQQETELQTTATTTAPPQHLSDTVASTTPATTVAQAIRTAHINPTTTAVREELIGASGVVDRP